MRYCLANLGTGVTLMLDFTQEEKDFFMSEALKEAEKSLDKQRFQLAVSSLKMAKS